jgi:hypothetical protein
VSVPAPGPNLPSPLPETVHLHGALNTIGRDGSEIDSATAGEVRHGEPGTSDSQSDTRFERAISVTQ